MDERRHGVDEMSEKIGEVRAGQLGLSQRLDALSLERQQQHSEAIKLLTDTAAQYHEIKHQLAQGSTKFDALDKKLERYGATLDRHVEDDLRRFNNTENAMRESAAELVKRIDDLFAWRNLVRGMWISISAIVGGMLIAFGHDILEFGKGIFHWGAK